MRHWATEYLSKMASKRADYYPQEEKKPSSGWGTLAAGAAGLGAAGLGAYGYMHPDAMHSVMEAAGPIANSAMKHIGDAASSAGNTISGLYHQGIGAASHLGQDAQALGTKALDSFRSHDATSPGQGLSLGGGHVHSSSSYMPISHDATSPEQGLSLGGGHVHSSSSYMPISHDTTSPEQGLSLGGGHVHPSDEMDMTSERSIPESGLLGVGTGLKHIMDAGIRSHAHPAAETARGIWDIVKSDLNRPKI